MTIHKFTDVFGCEFGDRKAVKKTPDRTSSDYFIEFTTPNNSEEDVRFYVGGFPFVTNVDLAVYDGEVKLYENAGPGHLTMFVNKSGNDPKPPVANHLNKDPQPRTTHLLPNHTYKLHVKRVRHDDRQPIGIYYYGNDKNQVSYADLPVDLDPSEGISLDIGGVKGIWKQI